MFDCQFYKLKFIIEEYERIKVNVESFEKELQQLENRTIIIKKKLRDNKESLKQLDEIVVEVHK